MDTRSKITTAEQARQRLADRPAHWISGHFDPLLSAHVRLIRQSAQPGVALVVQVTNPERPLLAAQARAELVAALSMVDYVVIANGDAASSAAEPPADAGLTQRFVEHALHRCRPETSG